jgi:two-component system cell cycle response regulator
MAQETMVTIISDPAERSPSAKEACLVVIYGHELGKKYHLDQTTISIGRSSKSDIQIDQESVSRNHAQIVNDGHTVIVSDLGSTNGTYVNDELIKQQTLRDGDLLKIGRTIFKFLTGGNIEHAYHEEIYRLTTIDGLTQVYNKRYFLESLERELSRSSRYKRPLSLVMFDIDHFKKINDTYGHLAGDAVLKQLATIVRGRIRREDIFARYGGEEFSIVLPEVDLPSARITGEKVRTIVERGSFGFETTYIPVTISVGVASADTTDDPVALIKRADALLYDAKNAGRNCCRG